MNFEWHSHTHASLKILRKKLAHTKQLLKYSFEQKVFLSYMSQLGTKQRVI